MRKEILTNLDEYVIYQQLNQLETLFAISKEDHALMMEQMAGYETKLDELPEDRVVVAYPMGIVARPNHQTTQFDIISNVGQEVSIKSLRGTWICHSR